nr:MAG TPA: hypothetical protein [Podoviridae sp. ctY3D12]
MFLLFLKDVLCSLTEVPFLMAVYLVTLLR